MLCLIPKRISLKSHELSYFDLGPKEAPPLLFVHGNSGSKEVFHKQLLSELATSFRCIAVDLPGHGKSSRNSRAADDINVYSIPYYAHALKEFIEAAKISNPVVIGHSLGGHIAIQLAKLTPLRALLVFQNPPLETNLDLAKGFRPSPALEALLTPEINEASFHSLMDAFFANGLAPDLLQQAFRRTDPLCRRNLGAHLNANPHIGEISILNGLTCPLGIFLAENDRLVQVDYIQSFRFPSLWRRKPILIDGAGHVPQLEKVAEWNKLFWEFLNEVFSAPQIA